jgi:mannose/fructose/N-acetylgalactosamine-specific phosphotransferase system component IIC
LLVEISALLAIGLILQGRWLIAIAVTFIGLEAVRVLVDAVDRLPNWVIFATSGTLLLAIGFVLLLKRELWVRWQGRISTWWRAWSPGAAPR